MLTSLLIVAALGQVPAQNVRPQIGYVFPPGGRAGATIEVRLGTYDWTPDMQVLVHDQRVKIEITGPASEPILTPPPYWFGQKAGQVQPPLPREVPAKITIPADMPPGPIRWQVANANGGSNVGTFVVGDAAEVVEPEKHDDSIPLPSLPVTVSGRISRIAEIDVYRFSTAEAGLVTCRLDDRLGQPFSGQISIRDAQGRVVADQADTAGNGVAAVFTAQAGVIYTASVQDVEFAGDRGFVYRLSIARGPRIVAALPLMLKRGATNSVEFVGCGVASGALKMESITRDVSVPADAKNDVFVYTLETPAGRATIALVVGDTADAVEPTSTEVKARQLRVPAAISGAFDRIDAASQMPVDRYQFAAQKGDSLRLTVEAARFNSPVDPSLAVVDAEGKEIVRNDDLPTGTDAAVDFKAPADGVYEVIVSDFSGVAASRANVYRLTVENPAEAFDFSLQVPDRIDVPLGGKADLIVRPTRRGAWQEPIDIELEGLPEGVTVVEEAPPATPPVKGAKPVKPAAKPAGRKAAPGDIKIGLTAADNVAAEARLATLVATATVGERTIERRFGPVLVATTLKTRCKVKSAVQDGGRIVNRGTTYPADILIERLEDYQGPVTLQMAATQQRQRRGIRGGTLLVPAGVDRVLYPVFMPEWLETSLTARINVIGVVEVPDPKGNIRHVTGIMDGLVVMSMEGALLKLSHEPQERVVARGATIELPLKVSRTVKLPAPAKLELVANDELAEFLSAEPVTVPANQSTVVFKLRVADDPRAVGLRQVTVRATALQDGRWPAVSETTVPLVIE